MNVIKTIKSRRSVRKYRQNPIPEEDLQRILEAARWAPSAGNTQPLEMVIIKDQKKKNKIAEAALDQFFITKAPSIIVICADLHRSKKRYGRRGAELYSIQDTAAAAQNIHLASRALGYSTCWVGAFKEESVAELLELPGNIRPMAIIPIGTPVETPEAPKKRKLKDIVHENSYSTKK